MPQTQHPAVAFLFVLLLIWLFFPEGEYQSQSLVLSDLVTSRLSKYREALDVLNNTRWGDFAPPQLQGEGSGDAKTAKYVNLTGFREGDGFAWEDLGRFRDRGLQLSHHAVLPVGGEQLWDVGRGEPLWANASGALLGEWVRRAGSVNRTYDSYNLSQSVPGMNWMGDKTDWARNMTGGAGRILVRMEANKTVAEYEQLPAEYVPLSGGLIRNVKATVIIEDSEGSGLNWDVRLWGVHWPRQGVIMMTTTSEKFDGIFGLPHLTPGPDFFQSSRWLLNQTLAAEISKKEKNIYIDQTMPWNSDIENPLYTLNPYPHCEFVMYAQVHPPKRPKFGAGLFGSKGDGEGDLIHAIESELESPQGAPIYSIPKLQISAVIYSPDCAFFMETKGPPDFPPGEGNHLMGMKTEAHLHRIKTWMLVYTMVMFGQVYLLKNQMKETFTPSTLGRVSFGSIGITLIVDGMAFTTSATWVSSAASTFLPTLAVMFASFLSMTIGGSFLAKIHEVQMPVTRTRREAGQSPSDSSSGATSSTTSVPLTPNRTGTGPILPGPVTAGHASVMPNPPSQNTSAVVTDGATAVPGVATGGNPTAPPTQAQSFQSIIGRFVLFSLCISFLAISSMTWYSSVRSLFMNICAFAYLSLWIPQIYRNIIRNCRRALKWQFVVGQSLLRLLPIAYFWVKPDNFLYARTDVRAFAAMCAWVWLQIFILATQDAVGPRFGIPKGWTPDAWDYHPVLREDNVEAGGLPIGLVAEENSTSGHEQRRSSEDRDKSRGIRAIDCAICREVLEVPVVKAGEEDMSVAGVFARRMYMVTPCRHIFHTPCLEGWMKFRLQCPICREELPPL